MASVEFDEGGEERPLTWRDVWDHCYELVADGSISGSYLSEYGISVELTVGHGVFGGVMAWVAVEEFLSKDDFGYRVSWRPVNSEDVPRLQEDAVLLRNGDIVGSEGSHNGTLELVSEVFASTTFDDITSETRDGVAALLGHTKVEITDY
ncbi:MAG: hypothetical protein ACREGD_01980 [Candidatus Saccharimonadales bacterium]